MNKEDMQKGRKVVFIGGKNDGEHAILRQGIFSPARYFGIQGEIYFCSTRIHKKEYPALILKNTKPTSRLVREIKNPEDIVFLPNGHEDTAIFGEPEDSEEPAEPKYTEVIFEGGAYDAGSATIRASLVMGGNLLNFNGFTYRVSSDAKEGQATILKYEPGMHPSITAYKVQLSDYHHGENPTAKKKAEPVFATTTTPILGEASQHLKALFTKRVSALVDFTELRDLYSALERFTRLKEEPSKEERIALTKRAMRFLVDVENHKTRDREEPSTWKGHPFTKGDNVVVAWVDSVQPVPSWQTTEDAKNVSCPEVKTYGRIISISKDMIVISQSCVSSNGVIPEQFAGTSAIPMSSVRSIQSIDRHDEDYED